MRNPSASYVTPSCGLPTVGGGGGFGIESTMDDDDDDNPVLVLVFVLEPRSNPPPLPLAHGSDTAAAAAAAEEEKGEGAEEMPAEVEADQPGTCGDNAGSTRSVVDVVVVVVVVVVSVVFQVVSSACWRSRSSEKDVEDIQDPDLSLRAREPSAPPTDRRRERLVGLRWTEMSRAGGRPATAVWARMEAPQATGQRSRVGVGSSSPKEGVKRTRSIMTLPSWVGSLFLALG